MKDSFLIWVGQSHTEGLISHLGLDPAWVDPLFRLIAFTLVLALALAIHWFARIIIARNLEKLAARTQATWDDVLVRRKVFRWVVHLIPGFIIHLSAPLIFADYPLTASILGRLSQIYILAAAVLAVDALIDALAEIASDFSVTRTLPIRSFSQVLKIVIYFVAFLLILSSLLGKSPFILLGGMGALAAILMLVFKDPILGFVGGIQLSANDMVQVGDWIEVPKHGADGSVIDIALTTIKVQNWDKTITTVPTYALISESFINWRGMFNSGGRRIKRALYIDMTTVRFCTPEMLQRFHGFEILHGYLDGKEKEIQAYNKQHCIDEHVLLNGRRMTNLGVFRAYVSEYLKRRPLIRQDMTFLVRHLAPTEKGIPLEIYVFCSDTNWVNYEGVQADIFDHMLAALPLFDLRVFQNPTGSDFQRLGPQREINRTPIQDIPQQRAPGGTGNPADPSTGHGEHA